MLQWLREFRAINMKQDFLEMTNSHAFLAFLVEPEHIMVKGNVPGPGTYAPVIEINKLGKYILSTTP